MSLKIQNALSAKNLLEVPLQTPRDNFAVFILSLASAIPQL